MKINQPKKTHAYLVTDTEFIGKLVRSLLGTSGVVLTVYHIPFLNNIAVDIYENAKYKAMETAHSFALWSLLGLLSSSCCALQLLLNLFSFGCAGFNTVLGPLRPTFMAFMIVSQIFAWHTAYQQPFQVPSLITSTAIAILLTLLPEFLTFYQAYTPKDKKLVEDKAESSSSRSKKPVMLKFQTKSMGCTACVVAVSGVLEANKQVTSHNVNLEDGILDIVLAKNTSIHVAEGSIIQQLLDAGFDVKRV